MFRSGLCVMLLFLLMTACGPAVITQVFVTPTPNASTTAASVPSPTVTAARMTALPTAASPLLPTSTVPIPTPALGQAAVTAAATQVTTAGAAVEPAEPSPTPVSWFGPYVFPDGINPLTGLPVEDPARLMLRPVAVKISNAPPLVRPQAGIGQADVVFEHYAEGGLTRFTALFLSQLPRRVGSVRSARLIDVEIPEMFESYLVYAGSSQGVRDRIEASAFAERAFYGVETGPPSYYRDAAIPVPHNLFADLVAVHELAAQRGVNSPPAPQYSALAFAPEPVTVGGPASVIRLRYRATRVRWNYNAEQGVYLRFSDEQPHFDAALNRQVSAANVVVLYANHVEDVTVVEGEWEGGQTYSIEIQLWGAGQAVFFRDGQRFAGTWERPNPADMFVLHGEDGAAWRLRPGVTFFQLVPQDFAGLEVE